jgi:hypothetical protein
LLQVTPIRRACRRISAAPNPKATAFGSFASFRTDLRRLSRPMDIDVVPSCGIRVVVQDTSV